MPGIPYSLSILTCSSKKIIENNFIFIKLLFQIFQKKNNTRFLNLGGRIIDWGVNKGVKGFLIMIGLDWIGLDWI